MRARHHRRLGFPGGLHRAIGQRHDSIHLGIDLGDAVEMGLMTSTGESSRVAMSSAMRLASIRIISFFMI